MKYIQQLSRQLALDYCCTPRRHPRPRKPLHRIPQSRRTAQIRRPGQLCPENNRSQQKTDFHRKKGDHRTLPRKIRNLPRRMVYGCRKLPGTGSHLKTIRLPVKNSTSVFPAGDRECCKRNGV